MCSGKTVTTFACIDLTYFEISVWRSDFLAKSPETYLRYVQSLLTISATAGLALTIYNNNLLYTFWGIVMSYGAVNKYLRN